MGTSPARSRGARAATARVRFIIAVVCRPERDLHKNKRSGTEYRHAAGVGGRDAAGLVVFPSTWATAACLGYTWDSSSRPSIWASFCNCWERASCRRPPAAAVARCCRRLRDMDLSVVTKGIIIVMKSTAGAARPALRLGGVGEGCPCGHQEADERLPSGAAVVESRLAPGAGP